MCVNLRHQREWTCVVKCECQEDAENVVRCYWVRFPDLNFKTWNQLENGKWVWRVWSFLRCATCAEADDEYERVSICGRALEELVRGARLGWWKGLDTEAA